MAKFRKKPVVIEAMQYTDSIPSNHRLKDWAGDELNWVWGTRKDGSVGPMIRLETLEGGIFAVPGDWIVKGVKGEFYPCKPDIFEQTYDLVED